MLRLYDYLESGNAYKVRLLLTQLQHPFQRVHLDILKGETRSPAFLAKNPNHRIPLLEWPDGRTLAESNAILFHLAQGSAYLPTDSWQQAQILQWMFFEQYSHEPYIAVVRFWTFSGQLDHHRSELDQKRQRGRHALQVMESHLSQYSYLVADRYTIADIALFAYTHVAPEGGFDLGPFPAIQRWIERVQAQPRHIPITEAVGQLLPWP